MDSDRGRGLLSLRESRAYAELVTDRSLDALSPDQGALKAERDLYRKLLDLGTKDDLEAFLHEALALILQTSNATRGYIELRDETCPDERGLWWIATGLSDADVAETRAAISRGVVAEALATGRTIVSASALEIGRAHV